MVHFFAFVPCAWWDVQFLFLLCLCRLRRWRRGQVLLSHLQLGRRSRRHATMAGLSWVRLHWGGCNVRRWGRGACLMRCGGELVCLDLHFWFCSVKWVILRMSCQIIGIRVSRSYFNLYHKLSGAELLFPLRMGHCLDFALPCMLRLPDGEAARLPLPPPLHP